MVFCDTSTLAKYYVPEEETGAVVSRLDSEDQVVLSELAKTELLAVFHRRMREGKWTHPEFLAAARQFQQDETSQLWDWAPLESTITEQAARAFVTLPDDIFLRAADCLHLITARHYSFTEIHTHHFHQSKAA